MELSLSNVSCGYTSRAILTGVSFGLAEGDFLCLLGPNGSGKTVLLKTLAGILPPLAGEIWLAGKPWDDWSSRERAGRLAYVPQAHAPLFAFRVLDVVTMGRAARWPLWSGPSLADWKAAEAALRLVDMGSFAERRYTELSGGERQMVLVARALAQEARFLVLDEPASSLDFGNQVRVLQALRRLVKEGFGVLMATHHPEHALRCASRVAVVQGGRLEAPEPIATALDARRLESIYNVPFITTSLRGPDGKNMTLCTPNLT